jgi:Fic family protein
MTEELLDRVLRQIRERLRESRAAFEESRRLEAALAALGDGSAPKESDDASHRSSPRRRSVRAPRGENLRRIRDAVEQRPGASAGEVAAATGIGRATVASTLAKLARAGELEKTPLPGGGLGYRRSRDRPAEQPASTPGPDESQPEAPSDAAPATSASAD